MEALNFRPEPFELEHEGPSSGGCGCAECRQNELDENEFDETELESSEPDDSEYEWETGDRSKCSPDAPMEVEKCGPMAGDNAVMCKPGANLRCPPLKETWHSKKVAGVPLHYGAKIVKIAGGRHKIAHDGKNDGINVVPAAWKAAHAWVTLMNTTFGMPISMVYTMSRGRYCRCIASPRGVCRHDKSTHHKCIGTTISDHGYGDAFDIVGVKWVDPKAVGSSLPTTIIHDWQDPEQAKLLIRMNAAMRIVFHTVLDWSMSNHRDHFHTDMNQVHGGKPRTVFGDKVQQNFIMSSLKRLDYVDSAKGPHDWDRARAALSDFARVNNLTAPTSRDREAWRPIVTRLYACVAMGMGCAKPR